MAKSNVIEAFIEPELKSEVEKILINLGLSPSEAIRIFFKQILLRKGLPFDVTIPNETTSQTFEDTDNDKNVVRCTDAEDMFNKLGI